MPDVRLAAMLLSGALVALFLLGFWLYCLADAILTPAAECRGLSKPAWIAVISVTFIVGAIAWLVAGRPARSSYPLYLPVTEWDPDAWEDDGSFLSPRWTDADDAAARHPAGRARIYDGPRPQPQPKGPDDDLEFLRALDRAIRGN
ncbi:MAG: PLD nuclease N-terminal domain-containing protein [Streptosporangiaceae bacterium]